MARVSVNTSRFFIISFGAALTFVIGYALTSELFARNSPTVIYNEACKLIERNAKMHDYLLEPYSFQTALNEYSGDYSPLNPPVHPRRPSQTVSSMRYIHPHTGQDTLFLHFFVESRDKDTKPTLVQRVRHTVLRGTHWLKLKACESYDTFIEWWQDEEPSNTPPPIAQVKEPTKPWWITRQMRRIVRGLGEVIGSTSDAIGIASLDLGAGGLPVPGTFTSGEVHAELVKDANGVYQWKRFFVDVPNTRSPLHHRVHLYQRDLPIR